MQLLWACLRCSSTLASGSQQQRRWRTRTWRSFTTRTTSPVAAESSPSPSMTTTSTAYRCAKQLPTQAAPPVLALAVSTPITSCGGALLALSVCNLCGICRGCAQPLCDALPPGHTRVVCQGIQRACAIIAHTLIGLWCAVVLLCLQEYRDKLYAEILKKKRELFRKMKDKEARQAAAAAATAAAGGGGSYSRHSSSSSHHHHSQYHSSSSGGSRHVSGAGTAGRRGSTHSHNSSAGRR